METHRYYTVHDFRAIALAGFSSAENSIDAVSAPDVAENQATNEGANDDNDETNTNTSSAKFIQKA